MNLFHKEHNVRGTRLVVAFFGVLCGLTGVIAGVFEILQGNIRPERYVISTIGPEYSMAGDFTYYAITVIPNLLITGILAVITSSLVIIWSTRYVDRKNGALILFGLSVAQMLVGGGWVIDLGTIASILATRIGKPVDWLQKNIPAQALMVLSHIFPASVTAYSLISLTMLVITVFGVNNEALIKLLEPLAAAMFIPILLMIFGGLVRDIEKMRDI